MLTKLEKALQVLNHVGIEDLLSLLQCKIDKKLSNEAAIIAHYIENGFEIIAKQKADITSDGREVVVVGDTTLVLSPAVHEARLAESIAAAQTKSAETVEELSGILCPQITTGKLCGGSLNFKTLCPSCDLGKSGFLFKYTCDTCLLDIVTKVELK